MPHLTQALSSLCSGFVRLKTQVRGSNAEFVVRLQIQPDGRFFVVYLASILGSLFHISCVYSIYPVRLEMQVSFLCCFLLFLATEDEGGEEAAKEEEEEEEEKRSLKRKQQSSMYW